MDKYQSWYKGTSKRFAEIMYSIEYTVKYFLQSLNGRSPRKSTFEMLESSLLTIFSSILWSFLKSVSLPFEKLWTMKKVVKCLDRTTVADRFYCIFIHETEGDLILDLTL